MRSWRNPDEDGGDEARLDEPRDRQRATSSSFSVASMSQSIGSSSALEPDMAVWDHRDRTREERCERIGGRGLKWVEVRVSG